MVIYFVQWERDKELAKGTTKGRPSDKDYVYSISVMCRNVHDALSCFNILFYRDFQYQSGVKIEDGLVSLRRKTIDSRNFTCQYLYMDGIREPLCLDDLKHSLFKVANSQVF